MRVQSRRARRVRFKQRLVDKALPNLSMSFWSSIVAAVFTGLFTILGIAWQLNEQRQQFEKKLLLDGAYNAAQETARLLSDGYVALARLARESHGKSWEQITDRPWGEFMAFHRHWRQRLMAHHFQLARYFGQDLANELIHVDDKNFDQDASDTKGSGLCTLLSVDMERLMQQAECYLRLASVTLSLVESDTAAGMSGFVENRQQYDSLMKEAQELIEEYDKSTIRFLRAMEARLTQLRGGPYIVVMHSPK